MAQMDIVLPNDAVCLHCGYSLTELTVARCPECGKPFDPSNRRSFGPQHRNRLWLVIALYLLPMFASGITFIVSAPSGSAPFVAYIMLAMASTLGPFNELLWTPTIVHSLEDLLCFIGIIWLIWFILLWRTRIRNLSYFVHFFLSLVSCTWGHLRIVQVLDALNR